MAGTSPAMTVRVAFRAPQRSRPPASALLRPHPMLDEVADFAGAAVRLQNFGVDAVAPGEVETGRILVEGRQVISIGESLVGRAAEAFAHEDVGAAAQDRAEFAERELRVILHAPERAAVAPDLGGLNRRGRVARQYGAVL